MMEHAKTVKKKLLSLINHMDQNRKDFVSNPDKDFTRKGKLPFTKLIHLMLAMGGKSLNKEILSYFDYDPDACSKSAFVQKRDKLNEYTFQYLLNKSAKTIENPKCYNGYRLLAVDGSSLNIPLNPKDPLTYVQHKNVETGYNSLHLNGLFDLCNKLYLDATIQKGKNMNEYRALIDMVDRSEVTNDAILIADRGYESYNVFAHVHEKNWRYIIRGKDVTSNGIAARLALPDCDEFDETITLTLTRRQTNEVKAYPERYRFLPINVSFDYFTNDTKGYPITFRVVRIKLSDTAYETLFTNLDVSTFPADILKHLYHLRWGIETSFRELKHAIGLTAFHSKKVTFNIQEIFARLVMYNFCEMIITPIILQKMDRKHVYQVNFTMAIHICMQFLRQPMNKGHLNVEALIRKYIEPIRPDRHYPRRIRRGFTISFLYRVA